MQLNMYWKKVSCLYFLLILSTSIQVLSCECRSAFFSMQKDRYFKAARVINSKYVISLSECSIECNLLDGCVSWDMVLVPTTTTLHKYLCQLNNNTGPTTTRKGSLFGEKIITQRKSSQTMFSFTTLDGKDREGPTNVSGYHGTTLEGQVSLQDGIQIWQIPETGTYQIEACGASGGEGRCKQSAARPEGLGARVVGTFHLNKNGKMRILVGQQGLTGNYFNDKPGGGGGATFVTCSNTTLIVAGGGGGGAGCEGSSGGDNGQQGPLGSRCNGTLKQGSKLCGAEDSMSKGSGGAGLLGDGMGEPLPGGKSFINGGIGGDSQTGSHGGFGGGGYGWTSPGGGGGYSGGGVWSNESWSVAGGGGSFNNGQNKKFGLCVRGNGSVTIQRLSS